MSFERAGRVGAVFPAVRFEKGNPMRNIIIIGSGCAGNTAAIYTARAGLSPLVIGGHEPGGQLSLTTEVENFPGFPEGIMGPQLVENMKQQAIRFGAEYVSGKVDAADLSKRPFRLKVDEEWLECRALIVASGASARWLGLPNDQTLFGHGVSSCATCDGFFYRGEEDHRHRGGDLRWRRRTFSRGLAEVSIFHGVRSSGIEISWTAPRRFRRSRAAEYSGRRHFRRRAGRGDRRPIEGREDR